MSADEMKAVAALKREPWGRLRKLPSGRWQARYPGPDGKTYTARTDDDKSLTFLTKTDARAWLSGVHSEIARGQWVPPAQKAARQRTEAEAEQARVLGFEEYSERWMQLIRKEPNRSGKMRAVGTIRSYQSKVSGYLVPEFGDTPVREIDVARIRVMTDRLDKMQLVRSVERMGRADGVVSGVIEGSRTVIYIRSGQLIENLPQAPHAGENITQDPVEITWMLEAATRMRETPHCFRYFTGIGAGIVKRGHGCLPTVEV